MLETVFLVLLCITELMVPSLAQLLPDCTQTNGATSNTDACLCGSYSAYNGGIGCTAASPTPHGYEAGLFCYAEGSQCSTTIITVCPIRDGSDAGGITVSKSIVENETVHVNHGIKNQDTTNPKILQTNGSLQTNLSRTKSRRRTNRTLNETGSNLFSKFNRDTLKSLNGTILKDDTNCASPKERRPFKSNGKPNKSFSGVDAAAQKASIEHFLKNLNFRFVGNEVFQCIKMSVGLFGMGCIVLVMCFVIPWVDLNLHSLLVYRRWYWYDIREHRKWWKKKNDKEPSFNYSDEYAVYVMLSFVFICIYVIGIPLTMFVVLWRNKKHLYVEEGKEATERQQEVEFEFGSMYTQCK